MARDWTGIPSDRVVAVLASLDTARVQVGSGYLVTDRFVLTARHCVVDKRTGRPANELRVARRSGGEAVATVLAEGTDLDVALIGIEGPPWIVPITSEDPGFGRVDRSRAAELHDCQAIGFPLWQLDPQDHGRNAAELHGVIRATEDVESGLLVMRDSQLADVTTPASVGAADKIDGSPWGGLSGALVFYCGMALGVVIEHHPRQGRSAIRILPIERIASSLSRSEPGNRRLATLLRLAPVDALPIAETTTNHAASENRADHEHAANDESQSDIITKWVHGGNPGESFVGRTSELARLDRWAHDTKVKLIGVTAWGGIGKTALVTEWLVRRDGAEQRKVRGVFAWSFYEINSVERWAQALLDWVESGFDVRSEFRDLADQVLDVLMRIPILIMLDGLEVIQDWTQGSHFGILFDGNLRSILTGLCHSTSNSLAVLTSRFPFADVQQFDGGAARMLEVPSLTPKEGAEVLRFGAGWLPENELMDLSREVNGHALALEVLAGALATHPSATDLEALRTELRKAEIDKRVTKVLNFYARNLSSAQRVLISIIAMFPRPVPVDAILALGENEAFGMALKGWTTSIVERTVRQSLNGLLAWYGDETVSAHPLVRDAFKESIMSPARAREVSSIQLRKVPFGEIVSREHALVLVESIEILLDADLWGEADALYRSRTGNSGIWRKLAEARLGQRCGTAFVATPYRMQQCTEQLNDDRLCYYLNTAGLFGLHAGDLQGSLHYLRAAVESSRQRSDREREFSVTLGNLAECLIYCGDTESARAAAMEATSIAAHVSYSNKYGSPSPELVVMDAYLAAALDLGGKSVAAERSFSAANQRMLEMRNSRLYSMWAAWWADFLLRTGRISLARDLSEQVNWLRGSRLDRARSLRLLARCDLASNPDRINTKHARNRLQNAVNIFRDGGYLLEVADTLPDLATCSRLSGELDEAEQICAEAIAIARPREQVPAHSRALSCRAACRRDRFMRSARLDDLEAARDDADAARRLAGTHTYLPWHELSAAEVLAEIDELVGSDHGFRDMSELLRTTLIPPGLNSDIMQ